MAYGKKRGRKSYGRRSKGKRKFARKSSKKSLPTYRMQRLGGRL